ncbi:MAG: hypothetical protein ABIP12_05115, partial [Terriglobales bacterium]
PALQLTIREEGDEDYYLNLTQEQIERFPEYKEEALASDDEWTDYERQYEKSIDDGPVMHVKDSTRLITPEPSQVKGAGPVGGSPIDHAAATPRRIGHDRPLFGATSTADSVETPSLITEPQPASSLASSSKDMPDERRTPSRGRRFEDFEERLRREREEILRRRAA